MQNQLTMVGTCINVAESPEHKPTWEGQEPLAFGPDLAQLSALFGQLSAKAVLIDAAASTGAADAKSVAESTLEDSAYAVARACANYFKKQGDRDRLGKVDYTKSEIVRLRAQELVTQAASIHAIAQATSTEPAAAQRGITPARLATLAAALEAYRQVINEPRSQIVQRSTLLREFETEHADLMSQLTDLDDLILLFDTTPTAQRFQEAWKRARIIVDSGGGRSKEETPPTPPANPA